MRKKLSPKMLQSKRNKIRLYWEERKRLGIKQWNYGLTKETNEGMRKNSESNKGKHFGDDNGFYKKHHTVESKEMMKKQKEGKSTYRKGLSWKEEYGEERAKEMKINQSSKRKNKKYEEIFGISKALQLREKRANQWKNFPTGMELNGKGVPRSSQEIKFEKRLIEIGKIKGEDFKTNIVICGFVPDFYFPNEKVNVEIDGIYYHNLPKMKNRDIRKRKAYQLNGFKLITFTDVEIDNDINGCIDELLNFLIQQKTEVINLIQ